MLEGLEATEIRFKQIPTNNEVFRYDAEYFQKAHLLLDSTIRGGEHIIVEDDFDVSKLAGFEFTKYYTPHNMESKDSYIALTSKNIQQNNLVLNDYITIDKTIADTFLTRSKIAKHDIVLSYTGEYRRALVMLGDGYQLGPNICRIRPISGAHIDSFYLSVFLNCKYGQQLLDREKTLSAQPTVAMSRIRKLPIPVLGPDVQKTIAAKYLEADELRNLSEGIYKNAMSSLLNNLGLKDYIPEPDSKNVKTLKESFLSSGRFDAEYYQPKFDQLFSLLEAFPSDTIGNLASLSKSVEPGSEAYQDSGIPFVRVQDLSVFGLSETEVHLSETDFGNVIRPKKDTILLSKDGSIGIAYKVEQDLDCITSGAILHLIIKEKKILPNYFTLVLNSVVVKMQSERDAGGSIIQHWKPSEIEKVVIPILPKSTQQELSDMVDHSFELRKQSLALLQEVKDLVEKSIQEKEGI